MILRLWFFYMDLLQTPPVNSVLLFFFQWVLGKSVEKLIRESPPECLVDPELGRHLYVKINVSDLSSLHRNFLSY